MRDTVRQILECLAAARPVACCRLVETRGSTPQKAGALMLVFADGSQAGTLGGGCVEAEVKRRALTLLSAGRAELATFQLDSDYGWDDGLICGGRMRILIQPIAGDAPRKYFEQLAEAVRAGQGVTEAVALDVGQDAAPRAWLFDEQGRCVANLGGSAPPAEVLTDLRPLADRPRPYVSGNTSYLTLHDRCRLVIVGGGHVGQAVAALAADLDFDVWVVDDRQEFLSPERLPRAERRIHGEIGSVLAELEITPTTYCLIVTRGHQHDQVALYHLAERSACYVGMIGSRRKIRLIFDDLLSEGISAQALDRVHAPVGIDIGSQTVPEIAVSICAELVAFRNRHGQVPGRPQPVNATLGGPTP